MKVFLDSDVILDFLTGRNLFLDETKAIIDKGLKYEIDLYTSSLIIANIHYYISRIDSKSKAKSKVQKLTSFIKILSVGETEILNALDSKFSDFEDAIQNQTAENQEMNVLITRNVKDFKHSNIAILNPKEFLNFVKN